MKLDLATVEHIAALARLGLTDAEMERMRDQLSSVLEHISTLNEVDISGIPPTAQVIELQSVMREDEVTPSLTPEQALMNAPRQQDGFFVVNAVFEES